MRNRRAGDLQRGAKTVTRTARINNAGPSISATISALSACSGGQRPACRAAAVSLAWHNEQVLPGVQANDRVIRKRRQQGMGPIRKAVLQDRSGAPAQDFIF